ncbi:hypothetical protein PFISCL1PPCAC_27014, partial [Pristionchus fissidentatus]
SLVLLLAGAAYAATITDNGYPIPDYDPLPTEGDPTDGAPEDTNWEPVDRELHNGLNDPEFHGPVHNGEGFPHHIHGHRGFPFRGFHGRPCHRHFGHHHGHHHGHHFTPAVVVSDHHHVIAHPKKPCNKIVKHVTVHAVAHRPHHHHHHDSSSSSEEPCGCRAHRHHGHHHLHSSSSEEDDHHHHHGHHGHSPF